MRPHRIAWQCSSIRLAVLDGAPYVSLCFRFKIWGVSPCVSAFPVPPAPFGRPRSSTTYDQLARCGFCYVQSHAWWWAHLRFQTTGKKTEFTRQPHRIVGTKPGYRHRFRARNRPRISARFTRIKTYPEFSDNNVQRVAAQFRRRLLTALFRDMGTGIGLA